MCTVFRDVYQSVRGVSIVYLDSASSDVIGSAVVAGVHYIFLLRDFATLC